MIYDRVWLCHRLPAQKIGSGEWKKGKREAAAIPPAVLLYRDRPRDGSETFCVPVEEYLGGEMTGPWSDVYSICAVMYSLLTGRRPADAKARMRGELLEPPSRLGVSIGANRERVIMKGLEILQKDRWQNGRKLYQALFEEVNDHVSDAVPAEKPERTDAAEGNRAYAGYSHMVFRNSDGFFFGYTGREAAAILGCIRPERRQRAGMGAGEGRRI